MRILGLVPARGGSKGVPRKNVRDLAGKPLIAHTIQAAREASSIGRVVVSTDDEEIADAARSAGAEVPFLRPATLAQDDTPMAPVISHAVDALDSDGWRADAVCLLQPTFPFRAATDIDECLALLTKSGADCAISVLPVPHAYNPHWVYERAKDGSLQLCTGASQPIARRQDLPEMFHRSGSLYAFRADLVRGGDSIYGDHVVGYVEQSSISCNIDTPEDWAKAEAIAAELRTRHG